MVLLLPVLLALLPAAQEPVAAETPAQALDALIERTNGLDAFLARWSMRKGEDETVHLTLRYQAPDRMRLDMAQAVGEGDQRASTWVVGTRLAARASRGEGESLAGEVDYAEVPGPVAAALYELDARFPAPVLGLGPGAAVDVHWGVDEETDKAEFDLQLIYAAGDRRSLVRWLGHLRDQVEGCSLEGEQLLWRREDDRIALRVSLRTGFLEALDMVGAQGERLELRLEELDLAPAFEADVFDVPPRPEGAREMFPDGGARILGGPAGARRSILVRVSAAVTDGRRSWDEGTREDALAVLRVLHSGVLSGVQAGMGDGLASRLDRLVSWMREEQAKAPPGDRMVEQRLREAAAEWRDGLARSIDAELPTLLGSLEAPPAQPEGGEHLDELIALERELLEQLFEQLVRAPLLEAFDELVDEVLGA